MTENLKTKVLDEFKVSARDSVLQTIIFHLFSLQSSKVSEQFGYTWTDWDKDLIGKLRQMSAHHVTTSRAEDI